MLPMLFTCRPLSPFNLNKLHYSFKSILDSTLQFRSVFFFSFLILVYNGLSIVNHFQQSRFIPIIHCSILAIWIGRKCWGLFEANLGLQWGCWKLYERRQDDMTLVQCLRLNCCQSSMKMHQLGWRRWRLVKHDRCYMPRLQWQFSFRRMSTVSHVLSAVPIYQNLHRIYELDSCI